MFINQIYFFICQTNFKVLKNVLFDSLTNNIFLLLYYPTPKTSYAYCWPSCDKLCRCIITYHSTHLSCGQTHSPMSICLKFIYVRNYFRYKRTKYKCNCVLVWNFEKCCCMQQFHFSTAVLMGCIQKFYLIKIHSQMFKDPHPPHTF